MACIAKQGYRAFRPCFESVKGRELPFEGRRHLCYESSEPAGVSLLANTFCISDLRWIPAFEELSHLVNVGRLLVYFRRGVIRHTDERQRYP